MKSPLLILIAGPYRSGANDVPELLAQNLANLEAAAWPIFRAGHIPMISEWVSLPVPRWAGGAGSEDPRTSPPSQRLLQECDAVLRIPGASTGADQEVKTAQERGLPVYYSLEEIPGYTGP